MYFPTLPGTTCVVFQRILIYTTENTTIKLQFPNRRSISATHPNFRFSLNTMLSRLVVSPSDVRHYLTIFEKDGKTAMSFLQNLNHEISIRSIICLIVSKYLLFFHRHVHPHRDWRRAPLHCKRHGFRATV